MATHTSILKLDQDTYLFNALIGAYLKLGLLNHAHKVLHSLRNPDVVSFSAVISVFAKSGRENEAIRLFFEMRNLGIEANEHSFVAILTACMRVPELELGSQIHCLIVKMGYLDITHASNALLGLYSKCGCLEPMMDLFDEMIRRNIASWNTVISAFVAELKYDRAFELFRDMLGEVGFRVDRFTLSTLLTACTGHSALLQGRELHAHALKVGFETDLSVNNALIGFYNECGNLNDVVYLFDKMHLKDVVTWTQMITTFMRFGLPDMALKAFDEMPEKNYVSYNALLSGLCQNGLGSPALNLFCTMVEECVSLDDFSLTSIINACGLHMEKKTSEQVHAFVLKSGFSSNEHIKAALLDMCTKCGRMIDAEHMFVKSQSFCHSLIVVTSMIRGYAKNGQPHEAIYLFLESQFKEAMPVDEILIATLLGASGTLGFQVIGEQIHAHALKLGFLSEIGVGNALISMYCKCGSINYAEKVFNLMSKRDVVSWNSLIGGYIFHRQGDNALALWETMEKERVKPDSITMLLIISAYRYTRITLVHLCHKFFHSMRSKYDVEPTSEHYVSLVGVFGHWGFLEEAEEIINNMPFEPNSSVWKSLLDSCEIHLNSEIAKNTVNQILAKKPEDTRSYVLVSNLYAKYGRWVCSEMMRAEMRERGFKKRPAQSWVFCNNKIHSFYTRDRSHFQCKDVYSGLDILILECLKAGYVPDTSFVLHEVEEHQKKHFLFFHSAKLALTCGLLMIKYGKPVRITKSVLLCGDCHNFFEYVSAVTRREIIVRDASGFHCFLNGLCSCRDYLPQTVSAKADLHKAK